MIYTHTHSTLATPDQHWLQKQFLVDMSLKTILNRYVNEFYTVCGNRNVWMYMYIYIMYNEI